MRVNNEEGEKKNKINAAKGTEKDSNREKREQ